MALPYTKEYRVWTAQAATATAIIEGELARFCPTKVIEIVTTAFSGTLDIQGRISPALTLDNVSYVLLGQGAGQSPSNAQISWTTDTSRYRYMVTEPYMDMSLVMARSAGSITVHVAGWGLVASDANALAMVQGAQGSLTNRSGTITSGGVSQQLAAANTSRKFLFIQNVSTDTLWVNFGVAAVQTQPSIKFLPNADMTFKDNFIVIQAVNIIGPTTGAAFTAKEA